MEYAGRSYGPDDLERGHEIAAEGRTLNGRFLADRITVTYNARAGR